MARNQSRLVLVFLLCVALHPLWRQCGPQHVPFRRQAFIGTRAAGGGVPAKRSSIAKLAAAASDQTKQSPESIWVRVKGGEPVEYTTENLRNVGDLLKAVKTEENLSVGTGRLKLYASKEAYDKKDKALRGDEKIANLPSSVTYDNPLHVAYEEPKIGGAGVSEAALLKKKKGQLREICRKRGLEVNGTKRELVQRIVDDTTSSQVKVRVEDLNISHCARPRDGDRPQEYLDLKERVEDCIEAVEKYLDQETRASNPRVPPIMFSGCMRRGKTTMLCEIFDGLKSKADVNPIFISFNGDSLIHRTEGERPLDTLLRAIAVALMKKKPRNRDEVTAVRCEKATLEGFLEDKNNVVLIIDELNALLKPGPEKYGDVGRFLRDAFLDPRGRHLVFSTHVPESEGLNTILGEGSNSPRDPDAKSLATSTSITALRGMHPECNALTRCEAAYYSCIPSIIYSVKSQAYRFESRFQKLRPKPKASDSLTETFLTEFFTGRSDEAHEDLRAFDSLTETPATGRIRWVLGYAGLMCDHLGLRAVAKWIAQIPEAKVESGQDWEAIVLVAVALRCVQAKFETPHPLLGLPPARPAAVYLKNVPAENCREGPTGIQDWWSRQRTDEHPYIAVLAPMYAKTELVDIMWVYQETEQSTPVVTAIQAKRSENLPHEDMPEGMLGLLFRGNAPGRDTTPTKRTGWRYLGQQPICDFLGESLRFMYPANWQ